MSRRSGSRGGPGGAGPSADPALDLLVGGVVPAALTGVVVVAVVAVAGTRAMIGAAVGTVLVCLAMSAGPLVMRATRRWSPPAVMAVALIAYGAVVIALGVVYVALRQVAWLSADHLAVALVACGAGWTAGELRAAWTLRTLAFGGVDEAADTPATSGDDGSGRPGQVGSAGPGLPSTH